MLLVGCLAISTCFAAAGIGPKNHRIGKETFKYTRQSLYPHLLVSTGSADNQPRIQRFRGSLSRDHNGPARPGQMRRGDVRRPHIRRKPRLQVMMKGQLTYVAGTYMDRHISD